MSHVLDRINTDIISTSTRRTGPGRSKLDTTTLRWKAIQWIMSSVSQILTSWIVIYQALVVQELDNVIHWINLCPVDNRIGFCIFIPWIGLSNIWTTKASWIALSIFLHLYVHIYASVAYMLILVWTKVSKSHAYDKSDSSWGFVKIENEQVKTVHVLVDKTGMKLLIIFFIGEKVNNK